MLTPSGNLQDWIDNQNSQVRSQSRINIEVWEYASSTLTRKVVLSNDKIESYSISESGSILGFQTPSVNINFTIFKDGTTEFLINQGNFILIYYEYFINGSWRAIQKGAYEISKTTIQNNGLVAQYEAKILGYRGLESQWIKGGIPSASQGYYLLKMSEQIQEQYSGFVLNYDTTLLWNNNQSVPNLTNRNVLSIICAIAQANGLGVSLKGYLDWNNNEYGLDIVFHSTTNITADSNYIIQYFNELKKPENIESDYDYNSYLVKGTITNYYETADEREYQYISFEATKINSTFNELVWEYLPNDDTTNQFRVIDKDGNILHNTFSFPAPDDDPNNPVPYSNNYDLNIKLYGNGIEASSSPRSIPKDCTVRLRYFATLSVVSETRSSSGNKRMEIDNPFVSTKWDTALATPVDYEMFTRCANFIDRFKGKKEIEIQCRIDPRMEIGDCFIVAENNTDYKSALLESYTMTYNGSFKGSMQFIDMGSTAQYTATFYDTDETTIVSQETLWKGNTPTIPDYTPQKYAVNNAVYSSFTFSAWSPTVAPITQDTDYYPTFTATYRQYSEINYSSMPNSWHGQIAYFSTVSRPGNMYVHTPHIANINALGSNGSPTIPSATGKNVISLSSTPPTSFQGNESNDDWQNNYNYFKYNTNDGKWYYVDRTGTGFLVRSLCKGQNGYYWFADVQTQFQNNLTPIAFSTLDEWWQALEYDDVNDCFRISESYGGQSCEIYYETT